MSCQGDTPCRIRLLHLKDYRDIHTLNDQLGYAFPEERTRENISRILSEGRDAVFVAEDDSDECLGYIHLSPYVLLYHDPMLKVLGLVVDESSRHRGIGSALLREAEGYAKREGYAGLRLSTARDRDGAHAFYEGRGFLFRKESRNYVKIMSP